MDRIRNQNHALVAPACDSTATAWEMGNEDGVNKHFNYRCTWNKNSAGSFEGCVHLHVQASAFISDQRIGAALTNELNLPSVK